MPSIEKTDFHFNFDQEPINASNTPSILNAEEFAVSLISPAGFKTRNRSNTFDIDSTILSGIIKSDSVRKNDGVHNNNNNVRNSILKIQDGKAFLNLMIGQYSNELNSNSNDLASNSRPSTLERIIEEINLNDKNIFQLQPPISSLDDESEDESIDYVASKNLSSKNQSFPKTPTILSSCNTPKNGAPSSWLKSAVSKQKNRFIADGFDLVFFCIYL